MSAPGVGPTSADPGLCPTSTPGLSDHICAATRPTACAGTGLTPATSAPGLRSAPTTSAPQLGRRHAPGLRQVCMRQRLASAAMGSASGSRPMTITRRSSIGDADAGSANASTGAAAADASALAGAFLRNSRSGACLAKPTLARVAARCERHVARWGRRGTEGADLAGVSPVPAQMWQGWAQSRCRCGWDEHSSSPCADVAAGAGRHARRCIAPSAR